MKYIKKPVMVEALKFTEHNIKEVLAFMGKLSSVDYLPECKAEEVAFLKYCERCKEIGIQTHTLEGDIRLKIGDYIIRGTEGELYPCKASIFETCYEKVED